MTRTVLGEIIAVALALSLGYAGMAFARRGVDRPPPTPSPPGAPSTATVAPAVTFTPAPTLVVETATPTPPATEAPATVIPTATPTPTTTITPAPTPIVYVVQAGDSLDGISRKFSVSTAAILRANQLNDPDSLKEGQKLLIPRQ
ncbi:MAG: LysM peptidoglycan-binding domain-containing protein [Chloroflexota bacterium]